MLRGGLFPRQRPIAEHAVGVSGGHILHVAEYGSASGSPAVYLHGGPGGGTPPDVPRLFDPDKYRVVVFDQRGCGLSRCADRLLANTTDDLVNDIEAVRTQLGIERWGVMGSSYGALMAALYSARHAERVQWALLHGVFLGSRSELAWIFDEGGASRFYPQQWAAFVEAVAARPPPDAVAPAPPHASAQLELVEKYHSALSPPGLSRAHPPPASEGGDAGDAAGGADASLRQASLAAAAAFAKWEDEIETLAPCSASHDDAELIANAQIAIHHVRNGCFLPDAGALPELEAASGLLARIPCAMVNGRHDVICPPRAAAAAAAAWPGAALRIVEGGAHALFEKPMRAAVHACLAEIAAAAAAGEGEGCGRAAKKAKHSAEPAVDSAVDSAERPAAVAEADLLDGVGSR